MKPIAKDIFREVNRRYSQLAIDAGCGGYNPGLSCGNPLEFIGAVSGKVVLELGAGWGPDLLRAALLVGPEGRVIGLDLSAAMMEECGKNCARLGLSNVELIVADMARVPLDDETVDVVISNCSINHSPDKAGVFSEIRRVLRPGGYYVGSEPVCLEPLPPWIVSDPLAWADCFAGAVPEAEYYGLIREAGLSPAVLARREYVKRGYRLASLTVKSFKEA